MNITERLDRIAEREGVVAAFDTVKHLADELLEALIHMKCCGVCAEDSWETCEGGRMALAAIAKAEGR